MEVTVKVLSSTREKLKSLKKNLGLKSVDAVINHLLKPPVDAEEEERADESEPSEAQERPPKRKKLVRAPLYSFELLVERHEMIEYYTGFPEQHVRLLVRRLQEVGFDAARLRLS